MKLLVSVALLVNLFFGADAFALQPMPAKLALRQQAQIKTGCVAASAPVRQATVSRVSDVSMLEWMPIAALGLQAAAGLGLIVTMGTASVLWGSAEFRLPLAQKLSAMELGSIEHEAALDDGSAW